MSIRVYLSTLLFATLTGMATAQSFKNDTLFVTKANASRQQMYSEAMRNQSQLYNGSDFKPYEQLKDEHPYLFSDDWINGTVTYDYNLYEAVPIQYDIQNDEVIIEYFNGIRSIKLSKLNVQAFTLEDHKFVLLQDVSSEAGFYEVLYDGRTKVYARYMKALQETISNREIVHTFDEKTRYFIYKHGVYHSVGSKRSVLEVLKDRKKELSQFATKNKIRFRRNKAAFISQVAQHYDSY